MKAIFLNCTLKKSPEQSNTDALIAQSKELFAAAGVDTEIIRVADKAVKFGISADEGEGDEWPQILKKIKEAEILIIGTPIWLGKMSSICTMVMERIDGSTSDTDPDTGQTPFYNKVAGVLITGNEDGAKHVASQVFYGLTHSGFTVPPNTEAYWVGDAGPGPSYIEAGGKQHLFTNKNLRYAVHNLIGMAKILKSSPIKTNLKALEEEAKAVSKN